MVEIRVIVRNGAERTVQCAEGLSLMEALRDAGVTDILALCGGSCSCGTCHVHVDGAWRDVVSPPGANEAELLSLSPHVSEASRLSCQITVAPALHGLRVRIAPED